MRCKPRSSASAWPRFASAAGWASPWLWKRCERVIGRVNPVQISQGAVEEISAHAREALPNECCGVLIGSESAITEARRTRNLAQSQTRFVIDPKGHIDAR